MQEAVMTHFRFRLNGDFSDVIIAVFEMAVAPHFIENYSQHAHTEV